MRSSRSLALVIALAAGCGNDVGVDDPAPLPDAPPGDPCEDSYLDYQNFGEPFALDWCRGCHSAAIPAGMRQKAPVEINFDTVDDLRAWKARIMVVAASATPSMPPSGGPSGTERALLDEWLRCGAR